MKKQSLSLALLLGLPLAAQNVEVGVFLGQQQYPSTHTEVSPGTTLNMSPDSKTVYAIRLGYSVVDLGPASFQLTAGYQPQVKSTIMATLGGSPSVGISKVNENHWSAGAMFNFKALVAVGAGLEFRSEKLSSDLMPDTTTYNRVWARLNAGYAIPSPVVKPFFGVEVAFPLSTKGSNLDINASNADFYKALAPKSQFGLYAGIRFLDLLHRWVRQGVAPTVIPIACGSSWLRVTMGHARILAEPISCWWIGDSNAPCCTAPRASSSFLVT